MSVCYYGKRLRQRGAGGILKDFIYYRCSGTDGYRFGGERICDNWQIQGNFIESAVWTEVCELLRNPQRLERQRQQKLEAVPTPENPEILTAQLKKLQRGMERLIDSYSEGVIEKEQFASRMSRTKERIAELEARIRTSADGGDAWQEFRLLVDHYRSLPRISAPTLSTQIGADGGRSFVDWSRESKSDGRASQSSSGFPKRPLP